MKVGVYANTKIQADLLNRFCLLLEQNGFDYVLCQEQDETTALGVIVVFGGDGTILQVANTAAQKNVKIIGINYGRLGFLTEFERGEEEKAIALLHKLQKNDCDILERTLLEIDYRGKTYYALNEISVQRDYSDPNSQIMQTNVDINGKNALSFLGDGVLMSTPTGSTAYSLSAGGAILAPNTKTFMLTPICSFSLHARAMVVPNEDVVSLSIARSRSAVLVDGKVVGNLMDGEKITIQKAPFSASFPISGQSSFYDKVCKKLK